MKVLECSFREELQKVILRDRRIGQLYLRQHPHQKYTLEGLLDDIIYVMKTGVPWRKLRSTLGWSSVYYHFQRFVKHRIFSKLFIIIRNRYLKTHPMSHFLIDTSFIPNRYGRQCLGRNQFYKNKRGNKISALTDINGVPLSILIGSGIKHDIHFIRPHLNQVQKTVRKTNRPYLLADRMYESRRKRIEVFDDFGITMMIKPKKNARVKYYLDPVLYHERIYVEHLFAKLKKYPRIAFRNDHLLRNYTAFVCLSSSWTIYFQL